MNKNIWRYFIVYLYINTYTMTFWGVWHALFGSVIGQNIWESLFKAIIMGIVPGFLLYYKFNSMPQQSLEKRVDILMWSNLVVSSLIYIVLLINIWGKE